jgi:hypothetical protein
MQKRVAVADLQPGDFVVSIHGRDLGSRVVGVSPLDRDATLSGPRGGRYSVLDPGDRVVVALSNGGNRVASPSASALVEVDEGAW